MDIRQEREAYKKSPYADKRIIVLGMLKGLEGKWDVFDSTFAYLMATPVGIPEEDIDEVFEVIIGALESDNEDKIQAQMAKLWGLQDRIRQLQEEEARQKAEERPEEILMNF